MNCWQCREAVPEGAKFCPNCGADLSAVPAPDPEPLSEIGRGFRELYGRYGADDVFSNSLLLVNGIGDVVSGILPNELRKIKNYLRTALDAGIGSMYLEQIRLGDPDADFRSRVMYALVENAGLSEKTASGLMGYFDEMIDWKSADPEPVSRTEPDRLAEWSGKKIKPSGNSGMVDDREQIRRRTQRNNEPFRTRQTLRAGDTFTFGCYVQNMNPSNGPEPIEWQVLDVKDGRALVISRCGLDAKPYNAEWKDVTWETCTLRSWLNGEFYNTAFSSSERAQIQQVTLQNPDNPNWRTSTRDRIFLLSIDEVNRYFASGTSLRCKATAYAKANGALVNSDNGYSWWWLRSPGFFSDFAAGVYYDGDVDSFGDVVDFASGAVRPAFWLNL